MARPGLPRGTVTFLFTDVEGSTKVLHDLGVEGYAKPSPSTAVSCATASTRNLLTR
jgi:hypothetical protein